jgi:hypothetical protein
MKRIFLFSITMLLFLFASCNSDFFTSGKFPDDWNGAKPSPVIPPAGEKAGNGGGATTEAAYGEWSDINNYSLYLSLFNTAKPFTDYIGYFGFETRYMVTVNVNSSVSLPVGDALVELYYPEGSENKLISAKTNLMGKAYLFPSYDVKGKSITVKVIIAEKKQIQTYDETGKIITDEVISAEKKFEQTLTNNDNSISITLLDDDSQEISILDLMFVIDTTSSMSDVLNYLKLEYSDVINKIKIANTKYKINLALLFYRDTGDEYITRYFPDDPENPSRHFTDDVKQQQRNLDNQSAGGGGDFPEAADRALKQAVDKNWTVDSAVRLIFHVCDAPPHSDKRSQDTYYDTINTAVQKGICIIPIASSGIDLATEYLLRQEAIMTGGTYIFLTDYTGKTEKELLHTVGAYTDESLNDCIVRVVNKYLKGN